MKTYTPEEVKAILAKHAAWAHGEPGGERADLSGADLSGAYLSRAYLSGADLSGADLSRAELSRAYLSGADLSGAELSGADLSGADLSGADLSRAYLSRAELSGADLSRAYLSRAELSGADLSGAYLSKDTVLDTGETWLAYLTEVLPQLLTAGERGTEAIAAWGHHEWTDCPMHAAFDVTKEEDCPALLRPRVRQFVQLYDAGLIPQPTQVPA